MPFNEPKAHVKELFYLPSISWFATEVEAEYMIIEAAENFVKSSGRNRTTIAAANGKIDLSIPIHGGRNVKCLYKDCKISYADNWQHQHWQSIVSAYGSAPFFEYYADYFNPFYEKKFDFLFDLNLELLELVFKLLKSKCKIDFTNEFVKIYSTDSTMIDLRGEKVLYENQQQHNFPTYIQCFSERNGFQENLSIIDLLFNEGINSANYLLNINKNLS